VKTRALLVRADRGVFVQPTGETTMGTAIQKLPQQLVLLERAAKMLSQCYDFGEIKEMRNQADAMRIYFKQQKDGQAAAATAAIICRRAERRIAEISREIPKAQGSRTDKLLLDMGKGSKGETLRSIGIDHSSIQRWEEAAQVPDDEFELTIAAALEIGREVTANELQMMGREVKKQAQREKRRESKLAELNGHASGDPAGDDRWSIVCANCVSWLEQAPKESARAIVTDPPYKQGVDYGPEYDDRKTLDQWRGEMRCWLEPSIDVLTPDGSLWVILPHVLAYELVPIAQECGYTLRQPIIWYESFGTYVERGFGHCSRSILWFVKNQRDFIFNDDAPEIRCESERHKIGDKRASADDKLWDDIWGIHPDHPIHRLTGTCDERLPDFPTQLPLALVNPIIACASDPVDLVVDTFSGSATTGAACLESGRRYIGVEISARFAELSQKRLRGIVS
jgi:DNA modification methylase